MTSSVPVIPGIKAEGQMVNGLRYEVSQLLGRDRTTFPGAQPISFAAKHLQELRTEDYYVCEKTDGIRCLMYLTYDDNGRQAVYLIDRKNDYYYINNPYMNFPMPEESKKDGNEDKGRANAPPFHTNTLLDGELVNDFLENGVVDMKFFVFDCLVYQKSILIHRPLDKRLGYFKEMVYKPYQRALLDRLELVKLVPFTVHSKRMDGSYDMNNLFHKILPSLCHGNDGLIFTSRWAPYTYGTDEHIFKWKPEEENTIDFRMHLSFPMLVATEESSVGVEHVDFEALPKVSLTVGGGGGRNGNDESEWATMFLEPEEWERMKALDEPLNDRIVECYLDSERRWRFHRFRDDKHEANHISTVRSVMGSIQDGVSKDDLMQQCEAIYVEWKRRKATRQAQEARQAAANKAAAAAAAKKESPPAKLRETVQSSSDSVEGKNGTKRKLSDTPGTAAEP